MSTSASNLVAGDSLTVVGSGFGAAKTVTISLNPPAVVLGTVQTSGDGSFSKAVTLPSSLGSGNHLIEASGGGVSCAFDPQWATNSPVNAGSSTGGLASTGFATFAFAAIAVALLGGGAVLLALGRRRRT
ncbi:MAG: hypothetical protein JWO57_4488 [Pseudonocardiales bacterium]|nr:hypothetical protein [Pseudonocardiales bacterium]